VSEEPDATTQDFIMINHPVFFAIDPARYLAFINDCRISSDWTHLISSEWDHRPEPLFDPERRVF